MRNVYKTYLKSREELGDSYHTSVVSSSSYDREIQRKILAADR